MTEEQYERAQYIKERERFLEGHKRDIMKVYRSLENDKKLDKDDLKKFLENCIRVADDLLEIKIQEFNKL
jgi:hypothetical protein